MNIVLALLAVIAVSVNADDENWFNSNSRKTLEEMKAFFEEQRNRIDEGINLGYKMKDAMNNYVEETKIKIKESGEQAINKGYDEINKMKDSILSYMNKVEESGRKLSEMWSFIPDDGSESRLENPEVVLSVPAVIKRNGYPCEIHIVESQGYLLNVHRIPRSKGSAVIPSKTVFLQHGLFASSADWIMNGPEKGLAYVLSDAGYDVWMGNIRGNRYSREHAWLKTDSKPYWNFSWHDVALHDIPAIIDHILEVKGRDAKISYIGHSMGTTILFAMLTVRPEYNDILNVGLALAPVVFMTDMKSPLKSMVSIASNAAYMEMLYGSYEFLPKNSALGKMTNACDKDTFDSVVCKNVLFYICGYSEKQFNKTLLPVFLANFGTGTSWKTILHFTHLVKSGKFQQFDYGAHNVRVYGSSAPPEYDLGKVTLPVTLVWSQNDLLSSEKDVRLLNEKLPSTTEMYKVPDDYFNHLDYLLAKDTPELINNKILDVLKKQDDVGLHFSFSFPRIR